MKSPKSETWHTSDIHKVERAWLMLGGRIEPVRRTGETRYSHAAIDRPLRVNGRRHDVPAKLITLVNRVTKMAAANDSAFDAELEGDARSSPR